MEDTRARDLMREVEAVLIRRVELIERDFARQRRFLIAGGLGVAVALVVSMALLVIMLGQGLTGGIARELQANRFVLRDEAGLIRGLLEATDDGSTRLVLRDQDGRERLKLTLLPDGSPGLTLADREGRSRVVLGALPDQTSTLVFADRLGQTRAVLGLSSDETPTLVLADGSGLARAGIAVDQDGRPSFTLFEDQPGQNLNAPAVGETTTDTTSGGDQPATQPNSR